MVRKRPNMKLIHHMEEDDKKILDEKQLKREDKHFMAELKKLNKLIKKDTIKVPKKKTVKNGRKV